MTEGYLEDAKLKSNARTKGQSSKRGLEIELSLELLSDVHFLQAKPQPNTKLSEAFSYFDNLE